MEDHLAAVAELAGRFAGAFGGEPAACAVGWLHDLGKYTDGFQDYLVACDAKTAPARGPDHKAAGAVVAVERVGLGPLGMVIQGHHGGLSSLREFRKWLQEQRGLPHVREALRCSAPIVERLASSPVRLPGFVNDGVLAGEMFVRMVFSALVDADYLDTERHFHGVRPRSWDERDLEGLWRRFETDQAKLSEEALEATTGRDRVTNLLRQEVYRACRAAAAGRPGLYRFTAPTGIGKTRSVLGFALPHALAHGQRQVIVAVPYVSITEQTARTYRKIFEPGGAGAPVVLEHHHAASALYPDAAGDPDRDTQEQATGWARLAAENWDAPIVVTTVVELFESIFACRPGRLRKLHRLANSVLVLDEVQSLPVRLLEPILDVLGELVRNYHTTVVLSTATQPAFEVIPAFAKAAPKELVPAPGRVFDALKRVRYEYLEGLRPQSWAAIAELVHQHPQVLVVVNSRPDALALARALGEDGLPDAWQDEALLHLSTLLCGAHRRAVLAKVSDRLAAGQACRLVATQVVEAGVDLDFPVVMRAVGPLDSIVQAAGRCNRNGRLDHGRVIVFQPEVERIPQGYYRLATQTARALLRRSDREVDDLDTLRAYFTEVLSLVDADARNIQQLRSSLDYPRVAEAFRLIEPTASVLVPWGSPEDRTRFRKLLAKLRNRDPGTVPRWAFRQLQPFLVSVRTHTVEQLERAGQVRRVTGDLYEWTGGPGAYDSTWGLVPAIAAAGGDDLQS